MQKKAEKALAGEINGNPVGWVERTSKHNDGISYDPQKHVHYPATIKQSDTHQNHTENVRTTAPTTSHYPLIPPTIT